MLKMKNAVKACMAVIPAFLLLSGCEKEEESYTTTVIATQLMTGTENDPRVADADVYVYRQEVDLYSGQNLVAQGKTDASGRYSYTTGENTRFYCKVVKGNLNNLRAGGVHRRTNDDELSTSKKLIAALSTTPVKLQLQVMYNGAPVEMANYQLYLSEADYLANRTYTGTEPEFIHFGPTWKGGFYSSYTGTDGIQLIKELEPRQYWFRVYKDIDGVRRTNAGTVFKTPQALPDNLDVTTSLTVGLQ